MKKMMIIAAVAMAALASQASAFKWSAANIYDGAGTSAAKYTGTAYLYDAKVLSQTDLYAALIADAAYDYAANSVASMAVNAGAISVTAAGNQFEYGEGGNKYDFYFAIIADDKVYFSNVKTDILANTTTTANTIGFGNQAPTTGNTSKTLPTDTYEGAGQWAAVPEPTSGLLLLLGMAGLALKRKQA